MDAQQLENTLEVEYHVSWYIIAYKMAFGVIEFLSGLLVFFLGQRIQFITEDQPEYFAGFVHQVLPYIFDHRTSLAAYLLLLGGVKILGAAGLIYHKHWGVDLLVGLTIILLPFQIVNLIRHPSWVEGGLMVIGLLIALYLINFSPKFWAKGVIHRARHHRKSK
jgi:uncharacterized membrane protein (DUF2068 family)